MSTASLVSVRCVTALLSVGAAALPLGGARAEPALQIAAIFAEYAPSPRLSTALLVPLLSDVEDVAVQGSDASLVRLLRSTIAETDAPAASPQPATPAVEVPSPQPVADHPSSKKIDPNFGIWQRRAHDKLQLEITPKSFEHPLARENPNDFIVVCEAGCPHQPDEIVSRVAKPERVASRVAPSAPDAADSAQSPTPDVEIDPAAIRCEAGCEGLQRRHEARLPRTAALEPFGDAGAALAAANAARSSERRLIAPQSASNGAIVGPRFAPRSAEGGPQDSAPATPSRTRRVTTIVRSLRAPLLGRRVAVLQTKLRRVAEFRH
ncbi:MAG: hypothetical protein ACT4OU_13210 [Hyphomicrobium sp.]